MPRAIPPFSSRLRKFLRALGEGDAARRMLRMRACAPPWKSPTSSATRWSPSLRDGNQRLLSPRAGGNRSLSRSAEEPGCGKPTRARGEPQSCRGRRDGTPDRRGLGDMGNGLVAADTDLVIDFLRGEGPGAAAVRRWLTDGRLRLTALTAFELRVGASFLDVHSGIESLLARRTLPLDVSRRPPCGRSIRSPTGIRVRDRDQGLPAGRDLSPLRGSSRDEKRPSLRASTRPEIAVSRRLITPRRAPSAACGPSRRCSAHWTRFTWRVPCLRGRSSKSLSLRLTTTSSRSQHEQPASGYKESSRGFDHSHLRFSQQRCRAERALPCPCMGGGLRSRGLEMLRSHGMATP